MQGIFKVKRVGGKKHVNSRDGWSKFVIAAPGTAIREGVQKSFASMTEHFAAISTGGVVCSVVKTCKDFVRRSDEAGIWNMART